MSVILKQDRYDDSADVNRITEYDARVREYYKTRTGGNKDDSWSEQIAEMLVKEARPHMKAFLESRGYILK
jgi:nitroreductase